MSLVTLRRAVWIVTPVAIALAYVLLRDYADRARSLESVLGLAHGDPVWHAFVAAAVILLRLAAYAAVGGALVAWPLEEWLLAHAARRSVDGPPPRG